MAASYSDLINNHPDGVFRLTGTSLIEKGTFRLMLKVLSNGEPVDLSGCTKDYASIDDGIGPGSSAKISVGVNLGSDGVARIEADLSQSSETVSSALAHPEGQPMLLTVRLKAPDTALFYLIAPSWITVKQAPGSNS